MSRPKKQPDDRRDVIVSFRVTPAERLKVEQAATKAGLSTSDYVRKLSLTGKVVVRENRSLSYPLFDQLRRIGVNLNQLTKVANRTGNIPDEIASAVKAVERFIEREVSPGSSRESDGS